MSLDTAQFCYVGSRVGWMLALQARELNVNWRVQNESTVKYMICAEL